VSRRPVVAVVDDDESVRESLPDLLRELGFDAEAFSSAAALLESDCLGRADALIVDVAMPIMGGFELQRQLKRAGSSTPIVFITARADAATSARALAEGAVACLFKPFSPSALQEALERAIAKRE
jgi:FixJ family two-component response regulator